ncbi:FxsA family membrane protein [Streptomyces pathocidini]|uniref:FxsA family membrane protein n=1 Tax=Streptomyces pathocidini TaxID=1650571 RepID=A0ABW7UQU0_9ACTN|nr:FxsA family membrane protein [Streptomyces pathocidini]
MTTGSPQPPPRRSRARRLVPLGVAAWLVLEIWLLTLVGRAFGGLTVLLLLIAGVVLGAYVVKRAGRRAWRGLTANVQAAQAAAAEGRPIDSATASEESGGNTLPMVGGLLLMVPGLLSDVAGLLCVFPPTRALLRRSLERSLSRRMSSARPGTLGDAFQQARVHRPGGKVVQGEVIREDGPGPRSDADPSSHDDHRPPLTG